MGNDLRVRPIERADFASWEPLWESYNVFYGRSAETALPEAITNTTWSRFFDPYEPVHALVAVQSGQILGLVHYLFHRSTISIEPVCYLQDLFTDERSRGKGIGRALIEGVCRRAQRDGCTRVYWQTHETNEIAMKLYDKVADKSGFVVYRKTLPGQPDS